MARSHRSPTEIAKRERDLAEIREQVAKLERDEAEAEEAILGAKLAEYCRPSAPTVGWDRLLPNERDAEIDTLHETVGRIRVEHERSHRVVSTACSCSDEIEAIRVAAAVLSSLRDT